MSEGHINLHCDGNFCPCRLIFPLSVLDLGLMPTIIAALHGLVPGLICFGGRGTVSFEYCQQHAAAPGQQMRWGMLWECHMLHVRIVSEGSVAAVF